MNPNCHSKINLVLSEQRKVLLIDLNSAWLLPTLTTPVESILRLANSKIKVRM